HIFPRAVVVAFSFQTFAAGKINQVFGGGEGVPASNFRIDLILRLGYTEVAHDHGQRSCSARVGRALIEIGHVANVRQGMVTGRWWCTPATATAIGNDRLLNCPQIGVLPHLNQGIELLGTSPLNDVHYRLLWSLRLLSLLCFLILKILSGTYFRKIFS